MRLSYTQEQHDICMLFPLLQRNMRNLLTFNVSAASTSEFIIYCDLREPENMTEFVQLLTSHQEVLRSYITSMLPNYQDVSDVLQDVNVKLWERQNTFEIGTNFGAWACTLARYSILSYRSKLKRQGWLLFNDDLVEKLAEPAAKDYQPGYLEGKRRALHHCLKKLKPKDLELLKVRYNDDVSVVEHAKQIGGSAQSLRVVLHRIRTGLKECVSHRQIVEGESV